MQASAQTCSRQHDPKCRLKSSQVKSVYFNHPSLGNPTNYYVILGARDKVVLPTSQEIKKIPPKHRSLKKGSSSTTGELCSQPVRGNVRWIGRMFLEYVERSFLDPKYSFVAVQWILQTIFVKQKFTRLRTSHIRRILSTMFANKCLPS